MLYRPKGNPGFNSHKIPVALTLVAFLLGLLLVIQLRTQSRIGTAAFSASISDQALIISNLVEANAALRQEAASLEGELERYKQATGRSNLETMIEEINRLRIINGMAEVTGPGIEVRIDGEVTSLDLQDLINEARNAGAEAISLNGYRVVVRSVLMSKDGRIYLEGKRISPPYVLQAIGHSETMERAFTRKGGLLALLQFAYPGINITVIRRDSLTLPLYQGKYEFRYARAVK